MNNACKSEKTGGGYLVTGTDNSFSTNSAEKNKGSEWVIAAGNVDLGSNRKNGKTFPFTTSRRNASSKVQPDANSGKLGPPARPRHRVAAGGRPCSGSAVAQAPFGKP